MKMTIAADGLSREQADLYYLVLRSQNMVVDITPHERGLALRVPEGERIKARQILARYLLENRKKNRPLPAAPPAPGFQDKTAGFLWVFLLCLIHVMLNGTGRHEKWVETLGASALYILQGEVYRAFTALWLHADTGHLIGNVLGILVLGPPLFALARPVRGVMVALASGTAGNLVNALFHRNAHLSIGASTAVMGMAGLLAVYQARRWKDSGLRGVRRIFPLAAGATLVALFSGGERTDVSAHVFGFLSGVVLGTGMTMKTPR